MDLSNLTHIGQRMEVARNRLGKSKPEIASAVGIGAATYALYERGTQSPLKRLDDIARALCVSTDYLLRGPLPMIPAHRLSYRRKVAIKSQEARNVQSVASYVTEFTDLMDRFISLPDVTVPNFTVSETNRIEDIVTSIRKGLGISDAPLRSAIDLVESMGVLVFWVASDHTFDGVSFWANERPYILLNSNQKDGYRARFTTLHELGHLICHKSAGDLAQLEEETKMRDREADDFASAFLMPATSFARRFNRYARLGDLLEERRYWMASCAAMVRRSRQLRMIDEDHYRRLCVGISQNGWRKGEPGAPEPERSRVHSFFFDEAGEHGMTPRELAREAGCPVSWLQEAFPQSSGYQQTFTFDEL